MNLGLLIEKIRCEEILPLATSAEVPLDADFDKQNLGNFVKGRSGIFFLAIADDVMALM
jgi:hypothetical protein